MPVTTARNVAHGAEKCQLTQLSWTRWGWPFMFAAPEDFDIPGLQTDLSARKILRP